MKKNTALPIYTLRYPKKHIAVLSIKEIFILTHALAVR